MRRKNKYKPGDRVAVFGVCPSSYLAGDNEIYTTTEVLQDLDGDSSFRIIVLGEYFELPSELLIVEYLGKRVLTHGSYREEPCWRIVDEEEEIPDR